MIETNGHPAAAAKQKRWFGFKSLLFGVQGNGALEMDGKKVQLPERMRPVAVAIMNQKGGCGKTTTVVNVSAALAVLGYKVLVVDIDPQAHASLGFGIALEQFRRSIYDLLIDPNTSFGDVMRSTMVPRLDVLPSSIRLAAAQLELANLHRGETALKRALKDMEKHYDFVFIDCPPTLNLLTLNALAYARSVLIPVQTHYYALDGMKELFRTIEAVRNQFNPKLEVLGILATLFDKRVRIAMDMLEALRGHFRSQMFQSVIHSNVRLIEAPMVQQPVISYAPHSSAAGDYNRLAAEIVQIVTKEN